MSSHTKIKNVVLKDEQLYTFRTAFCVNQINGRCSIPDWCSNSHCMSWQRRNPVKYIYASTLCPGIKFIRKDNRMQLIRKCENGRHCNFAHSKEEQLYHPMIYKVKVCKSIEGCQRRFCPFAHSATELRKPLSLDEYISLVSDYHEKSQIDDTADDITKSSQFASDLYESQRYINMRRLKQKNQIKSYELKENSIKKCLDNMNSNYAINNSEKLNKIFIEDLNNDIIKTKTNMSNISTEISYDNEISYFNGNDTSLFNSDVTAIRNSVGHNISKFLTQNKDFMPSKSFLAMSDTMTSEGTSKRSSITNYSDTTTREKRDGAFVDKEFYDFLNEINKILYENTCTPRVG